MPSNPPDEAELWLRLEASLERLEEAENLVTRAIRDRDRLMRRLRREGVSLRRLAGATGLSHTQVNRRVHHHQQD